MIERSGRGVSYPFLVDLAPTFSRETEGSARPMTKE